MRRDDNGSGQEGGGDVTPGVGDYEYEAEIRPGKDLVEDKEQG